MSKTPADHISVQRRFINPRRVGIWIFITLLCALTIWQWRARSDHGEAMQQLADALREVDRATRTEFTLAEAEAMLNSSARVGPIQQSDETMVAHRWRGPFRSYTIRLRIDADGQVVSFDSESIIPDPVSTQTLADNLSTDDLEIRHRNKIFSDIDLMIETAKVPTPGGPGRKANARVREMLAGDLIDPFAPVADTIVQSEFVKQRIDWYRRQWLDSFRQHSQKKPQWSELAESFLATAADEVGANGFNRAVGERMESAITDLIKAECDDPLVLVVMQQLRHSGRRYYFKAPAGLIDSFYSSSYPANVAWLAAYPGFDARELLRLQAMQAPDGAKPKHDLLTVDDPIQMRILYGRLAGDTDISLQHGDSEFERQTDLPLVLATQNPSPWLQHMLLASIKLAGQDWDMARACLRNGWYVMRTNPEAPGQLFALNALHHQFDGDSVPTSAKEVDLWFSLTTQAQVDYPPLYVANRNWLYRKHGASYRLMMEYAERCLATKRFDTDIPLQFLRVIQELAYHANRDRGVPTRMRSRQHYATPSIHAGLQKLVRGYESRTDLTWLKHYLCCSAYLTGQFDEAVALLKESDMQLNPDVIVECQVTPQEIQQASVDWQQPFQPCFQKSVCQLGFVEGGNSLICLDRNGVAYRLNTSSGAIEGRSSADDNLLVVSAATDGPNLVAYDSNETASIRDLKTFGLVRKLSLSGDNARMYAVAGRKEYWFTTHDNADGSGITITPHRLNDGSAEPGFAAPHVYAMQFDIAARERRIAFIGVLLNPVTGQNEAHADVWNQDSGERILTIQPFTAGTEQVAISADGAILAVSGADWQAYSDTGGCFLRESSVKLVDISTRIVRTELKHPGTVSTLMFLDEHSLLATGCADGIVRLWNSVTGELVTRFIGHSRGVCSLAWLPEKNKLASSDEEGRIRLWSVDGSSKQLQISLNSWAFGTLTRIDMDPETQDLLTESREEGALRWLAKSNYQTHQPASKGPWQWTSKNECLVVRSPRVSRDESIESQQKPWAVQILNADTEQEIQTIKVVSKEFVKAVIFPYGDSAVTTGTSATIWNLRTGEPWPWGILTGHHGVVSHISLPKNGRRLATTCRLPKPEVCIWELPEDFNDPKAKARLVLQFEPKLALSYHEGATLSPSGSEFLIPNSSKSSQLWDVATGKLRGAVDGRSASFSPDGTRFVVEDSDVGAVVYDTVTLKPVKSIPVYGGRPHLLRWGTDGSRIYFSVCGVVSAIDLKAGTDLLRAAPDR